MLGVVPQLEISFEEAARGFKPAFPALRDGLDVLLKSERGEWQRVGATSKHSV